MEEEFYDNEKLVEMKVLDLSNVLRPSDSYALVLQEVNGTRKLALIIGALEAQAIRMAQLKYHTPRPFTHELMLNVLATAGVNINEGVIYKVTNGVYYSYLSFTCSDGEEFIEDARTTDVVSLSMREGFPIYVTEELLEAEQLRNISADGSVYSVPVNVVDLETLEQAMKDAVKQENYERASQLRDEIKRRKGEQASHPSEKGS